jgi:hypothetical protein
MYKGKERRKKGRRVSDKRSAIIDMNVGDFICMFLPRKVSGISILTTIKKTKILP